MSISCRRCRAAAIRGSFLTARLGAGSAQTEVAGPYGPDPEPIRYLRHHAKYLAAVDLKEGWRIATATFAGMLLNWSAPVLLIVLAALAAQLVFTVFPNAGLSPIALSVSAVLTLICLVAFGALLRQKRQVAAWGGSLLALSMALTVAVGSGWLLTWCYERSTNLSLHWGLSGIIAAMAVAGPTILRFVPVFKTPVFRRVALKVMLLLAGIAVPVLCLLLFFTVYAAAIARSGRACRGGIPFIISTGWVCSRFWLSCSRWCRYSFSISISRVRTVSIGICWPRPSSRNPTMIRTRCRSKNSIPPGARLTI